MTRRLVTLVACALAGSAACAQDPDSARTAATLARDRAAIEKLHEQDIAATLSADQAALAELWTDDFVLLGEGEKAQVGKQEILASRERLRKAMPGFRISSYVPEIKDVTIAGDWAFEWGVFSAGYEEAPGAGEKRVRAGILRILRKQADGSWKLALAMSNTTPP
jgi:uncharacterized protein (TIGR02246 family)